MSTDKTFCLTLTVEIVRKAIMGSAIRNDAELLAQYGGIPEDCLAAARVVADNRDDFARLVWQRLSALPLVKQFFGHILRTRLRQKCFLASPIASVIFDDDPALSRYQ